MKFKFDPSLDYQAKAISAVTDLFEGQVLAATSGLSLGGSGALAFGELGLANTLDLTDEALLSNVRAIQARNQIEMVQELQRRDFSIEMETGTGKTYVYLRTLFELNRLYGMKKFIIVVPSIAIREGVKQSLEDMKAHFQGLYDRVPYDTFEFSSKYLGKVRQFASGNHIQIMVMNIDSFRRDVGDKEISELTPDELKKLNVIHRENDKMSGHAPIEFIRAARPVVIIDEPQSVASTEKSESAITKLKPLFTLRYSATHRNPPNLLYRLGPIAAYDLRLVKKIEVASIREEENFNDAYVKLLKIEHSPKMRAYVEIDKKKNGVIKRSKMWVKLKDDLAEKSSGRALYAQGYQIATIDNTPGMEHIQLSSGNILTLGQEMGGVGDEIMRAQVRETVEQHLRKELWLKGRGIKVLSLFFIDKVANYRTYNEDGTSVLGKLGQWFEEAFTELSQKPLYKGLIPFAASEVHNGYFSQDKQKRPKDSSGKTKDDEDAYSLIMQDKKRLLDMETPLRFIFSHTALREGWDNPNVFQICTIADSKSVEKKRQEIGRGLRLPVNSKGERIQEDKVNYLTVIANEAYDDFARKLQEEFEVDVGIKFGLVKAIDFACLPVNKGDMDTLGQERSRTLHRHLISQGYLTTEGKVTRKFDPNSLYFSLNVPTELEGLRSEITDIISSKLFGNRVANARERRKVTFKKHVAIGPEFRALWDRIKHRTRYRVKFSTEELIETCLDRIAKQPKIEAPKLKIEVAALDITSAGVSAASPSRAGSADIAPVTRLPDIISYLQHETNLTRHTLGEILKRCNRLDEFRLNPQAFM